VAVAPLSGMPTPLLSSVVGEVNDGTVMQRLQQQEVGQHCSLWRGLLQCQGPRLPARLPTATAVRIL
jgi:hypothetical protein